MTIGILGAGQLGRMLALAAHRLGLRCRLMDTAADACGGHVAELMVGDFHDSRTLERFCAGLDLVTFEFENVPVESAQRLARRVPVLPPPQALREAQDRLHEKRLFQQLGIPVPRFETLDSVAPDGENLRAAALRIGLPVVAKTRRLGYDGKGQARLSSPDDVMPAAALLRDQPVIVESLVPFERELSLLAVRGRRGQTAFYPLVENIHRDGILRESQPAEDPRAAALQPVAETYAQHIMQSLDYVGVLTLELFEAGGQLLANEMAPRVHNSGHWTIEAAETSQFENHLRAVLGWPLGSTHVVGCPAMVNLIGDFPDPAAVLAVPGAHLHRYGKDARPGRKLGHVTVCAPDRAARETRLRAIRRCLA